MNPSSSSARDRCMPHPAAVHHHRRCHIQHRSTQPLSFQPHGLRGAATGLRSRRPTCHTCVLRVVHLGDDFCHRNYQEPRLALTASEPRHPTTTTRPPTVARLKGHNTQGTDITLKGHDGPPRTTPGGRWRYIVSCLSTIDGSMDKNQTTQQPLQCCNLQYRMVTFMRSGRLPPAHLLK